MSSGERRLSAGMDEVGRGCIAGPVVAAIVILPDQTPIDGLADSKKLSPDQRTRLADVIRQRALAWAVGRAEASEIDRINILQATFLAMRRAHRALAIEPDWVQVDGNRYPALPCPGEAVVGGDDRVAAISAASILAKVHRDAEMHLLDALYPGYDFATHKGYPTAAHKTRLKRLGPSPQHRMTFAPVARLSES